MAQGIFNVYRRVFQDGVRRTAERQTGVKFSSCALFAKSTPNMMQTDRESEFLNSEVQMVFRNHNVHHYSSHNYQIKSGVVERFNRTLKSRMFRYLTHHNTRKWVDILPDLIKAYNGSFHRTIGK